MERKMIDDEMNKLRAVQRDTLRATIEYLAGLNSRSLDNAIRILNQVTNRELDNYREYK